MDAQLIAIAERCLRGAEDNSMSFPEILEALAKAGFEGYAIDFRRATAVYYLADGDSASITTHRHDIAISAAFDAEPVRAAIREAQLQAPGYSYLDFCRKVMAAGCAGYIVSLLGRRVLYWGRTGETHVELFPNAPAPSSKSQIV